MLKKIKKCIGIFMAAALVVTGISYSPVVEQKIRAAEMGIPEGYTPIYTIDELYAIRNNLQGKYILMNDIDLTEATAKGGSLDTGNGWKPIDKFEGTFDGNGYRIKGMTIYGEPARSIGLFGDIYEGVVIKNLGLVDVNINISASSIGKCCGTIAGCANSDNFSPQIENCFATGQIVCKVNSGDIGGIAGWLSLAKVNNCYNAVNITTEGNDNEIGGIAGRVYKSTISKCYNLGMIDEGEKGTITDSYGVSDCFYLKGTGVETKGSTPLTDAQMKKENYFTNFDFNNVWEVDENSTYQYPQLKNCMQVRIEELVWEQKPTKTTYYQGDKLNLTGGIVNVIYENGNQASPNITENMVSDYDMMKVGEQEVIVRKGNMTLSYNITVKPIAVLKVTLNKTSLSLQPGNTTTLSATVSPSNATYPDVEWSSSNDNVATVDQNGKIRAIKIGTAQIVAKTSNGIKSTCQVVVEIPVKKETNVSTVDNLSVTEKIKVPKVSITSIKASKKKLTIRWKKIWSAWGYQVQVAKNKKFTKGKKTYTLYTNKKIFKGVRNKTYYVRVRAYTYDVSTAKRIYGKFSNIKKKRTK